MYDNKIDKKWQDIWEKSGCNNATNEYDKKKFYSLVEFPYPSGAGMHVGHIRAYMGMDVLSRMKRLQGYNVLFPIGFDAFGLPTENYAMKTGIHPRKVTDDNIETFTKQLKSVGYSFDYTRVIDTTSDDYVKWTQWIFLKLFEKGLAYKDKTLVNYCPKCKVILANEESQGNVCDRCDSPVIQKEKEVWMLKITDYADKLLEGLNEVDFSERVKTEQINWIGRSYGAEVRFNIKDSSDKLTVYTTRPDTLFGATYLAIAPEHELLKLNKDKINNYNDVVSYQNEAIKKSEFERVQLVKEKTGVILDGLVGINPINGKELPIVVTDYVMMGYGTGAIMAVPAHDTRDFEFAKKFNLEIIEVISDGKNEELKEAYTGDGKLINSDFLNGLDVKSAKEKMIEFLVENDIGNKKTNYQMKDWAFARQRYWGEPLPIIKCEHCGLVPEKEENLPIMLPKLKEFMPGEDGQSPLAKIDEWTNVKCPKCSQNAKRETDTMPQWAGSSWYFLRYTDPKNENELASKENLKYWLEVDQYNGGMEHVTRHLIYSRFWHRFLYDIGVVPTKEPYAKRSTQGLILAEDGSKMSKSRGNVVNPDEIVTEFGADTLRTYILFIGEYGLNAPWSENGVKGAKKFLDRVMRLDTLVTNEDINNKQLDYELNYLIKKVTNDYLEMKYNTAIAAMMTYINILYKQEKISIKYITDFLKLLYPIAPHISEELNEVLGNNTKIYEMIWPIHDESKIVKDEIELAVMINSKVRFKIFVSTKLTEKEIEEVVLNHDDFKPYLVDGKQIKKIIVIKGRMVNIVI